MKERYRSMMEQAVLSDEARSAIEQKLDRTRPTKKSTRVLRTALIAACACVVLIGGAFAAEYVRGVWLGEATIGEDYSSYQVQAEFGQWKVEDMGRELQGDLENGELRRSFDNKAELEEYLGVKLADSEVLEQAPIVDTLEQSFEYGWDLRPELKVDPNARYVLSGMTVDNVEMEREPQVLKVTAHRVVDNLEVYLDARIVTGHADPAQLEQGLLGEFFEELHLIDHWILSFDENGEAVYETIHYTSAEKIITSEPYMMDNGTEAIIVTVETVERWIEEQKESGLPFEGHGARDYIGYFVQDGVLYSVWPYAVYDPYVDHNYINGYELTVLKTVLDSFQ